MSTRSTARALALAAGAFGVAGSLAPSLLERAYGLPGSPQTRAVLRLFGTRNAVLALLLERARDEELDARLGLLALMNVLDAAQSLLSVRDGADPTTARRAAATSASFAAVMAYARGRGGSATNTQKGWPSGSA